MLVVVPEKFGAAPYWPCSDFVADLHESDANRVDPMLCAPRFRRQRFEGDRVVPPRRLQPPRRCLEPMMELIRRCLCGRVRWCNTLCGWHGRSWRAARTPPTRCSRPSHGEGLSPIVYRGSTASSPVELQPSSACRRAQLISMQVPTANSRR